MKKGIIIALILSLCLLWGCSAAADSDVARIVDPDRYGSVLAGAAPSTQWDPDDSAKAQYLYQAAQSDTAFTVHMQGEVVNGYFVGEEFSFYVPPLWRGNFEMHASDMLSDTFYMRTFNFDYVDAVSGTSVTLLRIEVVYDEFAEAYGTIGREELGRSADGRCVYLNTPISVEIPDGFTATSEILELYRVVQSDTLDFRVLA